MESRKAFLRGTAACARSGGSWRELVRSPASPPGHLTSHPALFFLFTEASLTFAQRTSSTLHQGNARAILKRSPGGMNPNRSGLCLQILSKDLAWLTLTLSPPSLLPLSPAPSVSLRSPLRLSVCLRFLECVGSCSVRLFAGWASQVSGRGCGCLHVRSVSVCHLLVLPGLWSLALFCLCASRFSRESVTFVTRVPSGSLPSNGFTDFEEFGPRGDGLLSASLAFGSSLGPGAPAAYIASLSATAKLFQTHLARLR